MKIDVLAEEVLSLLRDRGFTLATAESCTGGWVGQVLTAIPGSSAVYTGGVISYTDSVKEHALGVPEETLSEYGAVSKETALAMAQGVRGVMSTDCALSTTGLAGPDGDGSGKPVGLVYTAAVCGDVNKVREFIFTGERQAVRAQAVEAALLLLRELIK